MSEYNAGWEDAQEDQRQKRKIQYGVQLVWADPVAAGAVLPGHEDEYMPKWMNFNSEKAADSFANLYLERLEMDGISAINRATRWAIEEYGEWEA